MQWERENFPKLNAWYEEGDYDSILAFCRETDEAADGISYSYTNWEHWNIVPFYDTYQMSDSEIRDLENQAEKDDFLDYKVIYKYVEEHKDRVPATD